MNLPGDAGDSPLHSAVDYMDLEMVQVLVDCGADVNARDDAGRTPLNFTLCGWWPTRRPTNPGVVRWLLDHGADPNARNKNGETSLHLALASGRVEIARLLVEHGASVKVKDRVGRTSLDRVSGELRDEIIKLFSDKRETCCIM